MFCDKKKTRISSFTLLLLKLETLIIVFKIFIFYNAPMDDSSLIKN